MTEHYEHVDHEGNKIRIGRLTLLTVLIMKKNQNKPPNFADTPAILKKYRLKIVLYFKIRMVSAENNLAVRNPRAPPESKKLQIPLVFFDSGGARGFGCGIS